MARIISLVIGRGGSSFKDKNVRLVGGYPLVQWTCGAARRSKYITEYYVSSDSPLILAACEEMGYEAIFRPLELATATAQSCDAVRHALGIISKYDSAVDIVVLQHANVGTISEDMIDNCIKTLLSDETLSAVVPSHRVEDYHPARAKFLDESGALVPALMGSFSPNRQDLPSCYFFDHSFWVLRGSTASQSDGQPPWDCMGSRILPFTTKGCFDVHNESDLELTSIWLKDNNIPDPKRLSQDYL